MPCFTHSDRVLVGIALSLGVFITACSPRLGAAAAWEAAHATQGPLRVCTENPRYFADRHGNALLLAGAHDGWEWQDYAWGDQSAGIKFDWSGFLDFQTAHHHNLIRFWTVEHTKIVDADADLTQPMAYRRVQHFGQALDGGDKFDLDQFNPDYFGRLRRRVEEARRRGIYVIVMLFQGWSVEDKGGKVNPWPYHPFHASNNVNRIDGDLNGDGQGRELHQWWGEDHSITKRQRDYLRHVVDTVNDLDNVLYEIANESHPDSLAWQNRTVLFLRSYEQTKPMQHPIGVTVPFGSPRRPGLNRGLMEGPADWISPNREAPGGFNYRDNPPPADGRKVILSDSDHLHGNRLTNAVWVWKTFFRGHNLLFMDRWSEALSDPNRQRVRRALGHAADLSRDVDLTRLRPEVEVSSTRFALAHAGVEYLVYQPLEGEFSLDLREAQGIFQAEWLEPNAWRSQTANPIQGGGRRQLRAPFAGSAILHLKRAASP